MTGSNFLLDTGGTKILIDCGLVQGVSAADELNWDAFPYNPADISFLIITHAHIDHIGRIPKLVKDGFKGKIISTDATRALVEPLLLDAHTLLLHAAESHQREPLYDVSDINRAMALWHDTQYHKPQELADGVVLELFNSGHILGSAMAKFTRNGTSIVFTGDLGGGNSPLLPLCENPANLKAEYLVMESVYGDRVRKEDVDRKDSLRDAIVAAAERGGTLFIPAFSTERTQDLLFEIRAMMHAADIPPMPVYLDSPLAEKITAAFKAHPEYFAPEIAARVQGGEDIFSFPQLHLIENADDSQALAKHPNPKIILAGSGMSNGGRALGHEAHVLPDPHSTVLIVGYQAAGSLGRKLVEGAKSVQIFRQPVVVRAHIEHLYGYSAHMDGAELVEFAQHAAEGGTKKIFVVMGEPAASAFLAQRINDYVGVKATTPDAGDTADIDL
ncbi:MAG: RNA-metabolising metallo-beta-lactamase, metallo-beta-lactamase family protein [Candidatus Adlerbacteria bacterium]|nr:RNA-metabolising metallo-beta-lactamase, metallo-beta-lactamase family protein [Candidatus Adlerbacteria bacterium]